ITPDTPPRVYDTTIGKPVGMPLREAGFVRDFAFNTDGTWLVTGSERGGQVWDTETGEPIGRPLILPGVARTVAFRPRVKQVVMVGGDGAAQSWEPETGKPVGVRMLP